MTAYEALNLAKAAAPTPTALWPTWDPTLGEFGEYVMLDRDGVARYGRSESACLWRVREANECSLRAARAR